MPINVDYGPIGTAMGLATQGGQNLATGQNNQNDLSLLGYVQRAQQMQNTLRASEIQEALSGRGLDLEDQRNQAQQALAQSQLASSTAYRQASLQGLNDYRTGRNDIGQQNADTSATRADNQADYNTGRLGVSQQRADTQQSAAGNLDSYHQMLAQTGQQNANTRQTGMQNANVNAQAANAPRQEDADTRAIQDEYNSLSKVQQAHERNFGDPNDPQYRAVIARMNAIQQAVQTRNTDLQKRAQPVPQVHAPQQQTPGTPANPVAFPTPQAFQQGYSQLPAGSFYTGPDGVVYQKGGGQQAQAPVSDDDRLAQIQAGQTRLMSQPR